MENKYVCNVVKDEDTSKDDVVLVINDWYNESEYFGSVEPIPESALPDYLIVKEVKEDPNKFYNVNYAL
jgi:hypothetical protein